MEIYPWPSYIIYFVKLPVAYNNSSKFILPKLNNIDVVSPRLTEVGDLGSGEGTKGFKSPPSIHSNPVSYPIFVASFLCAFFDCKILCNVAYLFSISPTLTHLGNPTSCSLFPTSHSLSTPFSPRLSHLCPPPHSCFCPLCQVL